MPSRTRYRATKPATRHGDSSPRDDRSTDKEKLRDRLLAMILRNEAARKQARR